jgi:hypothetical protein
VCISRSSAAAARAAPLAQSDKAPSAEPAQAAAHRKATCVRKQRAALVDREGVAEPVEVARMLIPSDWKLEGTLRWSPRFARAWTRADVDLDASGFRHAAAP